jgi:hypothetical protein
MADLPPNSEWKTRSWELIRHKNIKYSIYILQAREDFYDAMQLILTEREASEYILYISKYDQLLESDRKSTIYSARQ